MTKIKSFSITQQKTSWISLDLAAFQDFKVFLPLPHACDDFVLVYRDREVKIMLVMFSLSRFLITLSCGFLYTRMHISVECMGWLACSRMLCFAVLKCTLISNYIKGVARGVLGCMWPPPSPFVSLFVSKQPTIFRWQSSEYTLYDSVWPPFEKSWLRPCTWC